MKARLFLLILIITCCFALGVFFGCGDDDDDNDENDDDDDNLADDPISPSECADFCSQESVDIANECLAAIPDWEQTSVAECLEDCEAGKIEADFLPCMENFVDCDTLLDCIMEIFE